jgi:hypothetical protein
VFGYIALHIRGTARASFDSNVSQDGLQLRRELHMATRNRSPLSHVLLMTLLLLGAAAPTAGGRKGVHGMVVFGQRDRGVFLSHIPMFRAPHDVQLVIEVKLTDGPDDLSQELFTLEPKPFSLDDLMLGHVKTVEGTLYRGGFEQGGKPVGTVHATVVRVIRQSMLGTSPSASMLQYLAVGAAKRAYLIHLIGGAPSFDQILAADLSNAGIPEPALSEGVVLTVPNRSDTLAERLTPGSVTARTTETAPAVSLTISRELSILVGPDFDRGP